MYKNELVKIPIEGKGKIAKKTMKNYVQVMYVLDGGYNPETKICSPKRTIIGKTDSLDSLEMYPNDNYYKLFGSKLDVTPPTYFNNTVSSNFQSTASVIKISRRCYI